MSMSPERIAALSRTVTRQLIREVSEAGGGGQDALTAATTTAARVLCEVLLPGRDADAVELMARHIAELVPVMRAGQREGAVG